MSMSLTDAQKEYRGAIGEVIDELQELRSVADSPTVSSVKCAMFDVIRLSKDIAALKDHLAEVYDAYTLELEQKVCPPFPKHAKLGGDNGCAVVHQGDGKYWRHAGHWEVRARWRDGKLVCACDEDDCMAHANGTELVECTAEEWAQDNKGYL